MGKGFAVKYTRRTDILVDEPGFYLLELKEDGGYQLWCIPEPQIDEEVKRLLHKEAANG